jgi:hypothetical protein
MSDLFPSGPPGNRLGAASAGRPIPSLLPRAALLRVPAFTARGPGQRSFRLYLGLVLFLLGVVTRTVVWRYRPRAAASPFFFVVLVPFATAVLRDIATTTSAELRLLRIAHA